MVWPTVPLGSVAKVDRIGVDPSSVERGTLYVGLENIERGGALVNVSATAPGDLASTKFRFSEHHVLFGKLRPNLAKVARPSFSGICSTDILPVQPDEGLDRRYLAHWLLSPETVALAASRASGANLPRLNPFELLRFQIPLPSLDKQRRIADVLDHADTLRTQCRELLHLVNGATRSIFVDMFGDPALGHTQWSVVGVETLCSLIVDCVNRTAPTVSDRTKYKMIRTTNVKGGRVDLSQVRYVSEATFNVWNRRATPRYGDVLLTREAPVGEAGILRTADQVFLGQRLMLYRVDPAVATPEFLMASFYSSFLQGQFDQHGSGSTVKHLSLPVCRSLRMMAPPLALQEQFSQRIAAIENLRQSTESRLSLLDELSASLKHIAFAGQL